MGRKGLGVKYVFALESWSFVSRSRKTVRLFWDGFSRVLLQQSRSTLRSERSFSQSLWSQEHIMPLPGQRSDPIRGIKGAKSTRRSDRPNRDHRYYAFDRSSWRHPVRVSL